MNLKELMAEKEQKEKEMEEMKRNMDEKEKQSKEIIESKEEFQSI